MALVFWVLGLLNLGNGLWMLLAPAHWYEGLPAGVPDTGPLNLHFVRDIGAAFTTIGVALLIAGARPPWRRPALFGATCFYALHALVHVADITSGRLGTDHWLVDLPGVFLPVALLLALWLPRWWRADAT